MSYIDTTEEVMQPDHTVCDGDRAWARSIESVRLALTEDEARSLGNLLTTTSLPQRVAEIIGVVGKERFQELLHPNADGYRAMTRAIIRWSLTDAGVAAAEPGPAPPEGDRLRVRPVEDVLGTGDEAADVLQGGRTNGVQAGRNYQVLFEGFAPGAAVEISVQSTETFIATVAFADGDGVVDTLVSLPRRMPPGRHRIVAVGPGPVSDTASAVALIVVDSGTALLPWLALAAVLAVACGAFVLVLTTRVRRRATAGETSRTAAAERSTAQATGDG